MAEKLLQFKNKLYDSTRLTIVGSQSGTQNLYYSEANGDRFYYTFVGATAAPDMQAASFNSFLSFTMSNAATYTFDLVPMQVGETVMIDTHIMGLNGPSLKGYVGRVFGGFKHSGSTLTMIGSSLDYNTKTDFVATCKAEFYVNGTQSVSLRVVGQAGEFIDWDVFISYSKSFHSISLGPGGDPSSKPIYPPVPDQ